MVNVLLREEMRSYAFLLFHTFHGHLKARKYQLLFYQGYKGSKNVSFVEAVMLFSFAGIEAHLKSIKVFAMLGLTFVQTTVLMKISDYLLLLESLFE